MDFKTLITRAQKGDHNAQEVLLNMYRPLLIKESLSNDKFDEDLYQELCLKFIYCIRKFKIQQ